MKFKKVMMPLGIVGLAVISHSTLATIEVATFEFRTMPNVSVVEGTKMNFGSHLLTAVGSKCLMTVDTTAVNITTNNIVAFDSTSKIDGTGCKGTGSGVVFSADSSLTPGIFDISGLKGQSIKVTLTGGSSTDLAFVPTGEYYSGMHGVKTSTDPATDNIALVNNAQTAALVLGTNLAPDGVAAGNSGVGVIYVGGELEVLQTLTPDLEYTVTYNVNVTY